MLMLYYCSVIIARGITGAADLVLCLLLQTLVVSLLFPLLGKQQLVQSSVVMNAVIVVETDGVFFIY